jgi:ZIP family zinc transporter
MAANALLDRLGARHRKRSGNQQPSEAQQSGRRLGTRGLLEALYQEVAAAGGVDGAPAARG